MKNKLNFYEKSINEIKCLIKKNNYESAYKLVSQELNMPYIPEKYIDKYEKLFLKINSHIYEENIEKNGSPNNADLKGIKKGLSLNDNVNIFDRHRLLKQVNNINLRLVKNDLKKFFVSEKIPAYLKIIILDALNDQEIFEKYDIWLNGEIHNIDINMHIPIFKRSDYKQTYLVAKEQLFNSPNLFTQIKILINIYYISIFPKIVKKKYATSISCALILYICEIYNINDFEANSLANYYKISEVTILETLRNIKTTLIIHKKKYNNINN